MLKIFAIAQVRAFYLTSGSLGKTEKLAGEEVRHGYPFPSDEEGVNLLKKTWFLT